MRKAPGWIALAAFIGTVVLANYVVNRFGVVPVGFGQYGPAAVFVVGFAFIFRDAVQDTLGRVAVVVAIITGGLVSALISPAFALASATAFLLSESLDFGVYTPLRKKSWAGAIVASNIVGLVVDSFVFLYLATPLGPDRMSFVPGQIIGKLWATLGVLIVLTIWKGKSAFLPRNPSPELA